MTQFMYVNPANSFSKSYQCNGEVIRVTTEIRKQEIAKLKELKEQGFTIIGLEMTVKDLAELCDRNIDPQHTEGKADQSCAKEVAEKAPELLGWFKGKDLDKVVFITNRVDVDSVAAFVLADRYLKGEKIGNNDNVEAINAHDTAAGKVWQKPEGKTNAERLQNAFDPESKTKALASSIQVFKVTPDNIQNVANFIDTGMVDDGIMASFRAKQQAIIAKVEAKEIEVDTLEGSGYVLVTSTERAATDVGYSVAPIVVAINPAMTTTIESINPEVLKIANGKNLTNEERMDFSTYERIAKEAGLVTTVKESSTFRKVTICQHEGGYIDLPKACAELNKKEVAKKIELGLLPEDCIETQKAEIKKTKPDVSEEKILEEAYKTLGGWGGNGQIIGSPQGQDCTLELSAIKESVYANLTPEYKSKVTSRSVNTKAGKGMGD